MKSTTIASSSILAFEALRDIATNRKVKYIFSTGTDWTQILTLHGVPLKREVELKRHNGKSYSFNFKVFQFTDNSLPLLMFNLRGNSHMDLPTNPFAVHVARILLGIHEGPIPMEDRNFQVTIKK